MLSKNSSFSPVKTVFCVFVVENYFQKQLLNTPIFPKTKLNEENC